MRLKRNFGYNCVLLQESHCKHPKNYLAFKLHEAEISLGLLCAQRCAPRYEQGRSVLRAARNRQRCMGLHP